MILEVAVSLTAVVAFALVLWWSRIPQVARDSLTATMAGLSSMMDSELDDDAKEAAVRRAGFALIVASFNILWRFLLALAAASAPIVVADALGLVSQTAVLTMMLRWDFIIFVSIAAVVLARLAKPKRPASGVAAPAENRYSTADRFFHVLAFSSPSVLKTASWAEDRLLPETTREASAPPVFITSLARGGTTALLNALHDVPGIATHTYRDMPFLTAPTLWNRLAGGQRRVVDRHERAHGDGLEIDLDTPEAFEEVIWKMFWPEKYQQGSIALWRPADRKPVAEQFLSRHMAKIIRARLAQGKKDLEEAACYCSKNNANIARIPYLVKAFPGCRIIVPVRRPESHAASLLRQHHNFMRRQAEDAFVKRFMRDIGHFEFGQIHKSIQFPGFDSRTYPADTADYWLSYWIHAFREILSHRESCIFVLQDDMRSSPQATLAQLCRRLNLDPGNLQFASYFHSGADQSPVDIYSESLHQEAAEIYRELERACSLHS